jgi:anti-sigma B factor antagonist
MLSIQKRNLDPGIVVLEITGMIVLGRACQDVEWEVEELVRADQKKVILDLSRVKHLDSTGIGIIVMSFGKLKKAGGELRVAGAQGVIEEIFRITNVDRVINLYATPEAAAQASWGVA